MKTSLTFAVVGCGSRARTYMTIARDLGHEIAAAADPSEAALASMRRIAGGTIGREFTTGEELLAEPRLADVAVITTQDALHFGQAAAAIRQGYDILLEKPAACSAEEVESLGALARQHGVGLALCFVLRYTPFYRSFKAALEAGRIGDLVSLQASEGVGPFHQAHSYVRGHWASQRESTPMIVAKCSHDTDLLAWFAGERCVRVASFGGTGHFRPEEAPAGATARCTDPCPHAGTCPYDAHRYLTDQRNWLRMVLPDGETLEDEAVREWLRTSRWGRCVYHCGQDTPDHQVVSMQFANGITANLTMTAFDTGRRIRAHGTLGILEGALHCDGREPWIEFRPHHGGGIEPVEISTPASEDYQGHGGGDFGLIEALPALLADGREGGPDFIEGHRIAFAAARAAEEGMAVSL